MVQVERILNAQRLQPLLFHFRQHHLTTALGDEVAEVESRIIVEVSEQQLGTRVLVLRPVLNELLLRLDKRSIPVLNYTTFLILTSKVLLETWKDRRVTLLQVGYEKDGVSVRAQRATRRIANVTRFRPLKTYVKLLNSRTPTFFMKRASLANRLSGVQSVYSLRSFVLYRASML